MTQATPGKLAGKSALDLMDKACNEPNTDENVPRQMKAMLQLALEGSETWIAWMTWLVGAWDLGPVMTCNDCGCVST